MEGPPAPSADTGAPSVSVIVPAHGVAGLLGDALRSLQAQDFAAWEAIVVDDGDAEVAGAVAAFADDPRIRFLHTANAGVAAARNRAIAEAHAPLLALLDGDDAYQPAYLSRMIAAIEADPRLGFVTCDAEYFGLSRNGRRFSEFSPQAEPVTLARVLARQFNVFTACTLRRSAFEGIGGYNESLRSGEDLDLWIRLLEAGWTAALISEPLARYRRRAGSLSWDTAPMLRAVERVYENTVTRLAGRTEAAIAQIERARMAREIAWADGEALIRAGRTREGLARLREGGAHRRSPFWRGAMAVMRLMPALASPLLRLRERHYERSAN